ncbi:MAG: Ig-like domain-containing protein [Gemmatimonadetes bacterium]|nr:Ig-like domain-containing protein [Gemmatimonadota bacterium]
MRRFACCLLLIAAAACQEDPAGPVPREIRSLATDTLTGIVGTPADTIVVIRVVDAEGNGVQGKSVTFLPAANAGSVTPASATTGADGMVSTTWTLGATPGVQQLTVRGVGLTDVIVPAIALSAPTPREVAVSAFRSHSCRLVAGVASCWGDNAAGKLGVGDLLPRAEPSVVAGGAGVPAFKVLAMGSSTPAARPGGLRMVLGHEYGRPARSRRQHGFVPRPRGVGDLPFS